MGRENVSMGVGEILQFAIRIEENGEKFYRDAAGASDIPELRELFSTLADQELEHKKTFEKMLPEVEKYEPAEAYPPEYFAYLRAYANNIVFKVDTYRDLSDKMNPVSVLEFGIRRELDSIAYYNEARGFVPDKQRKLIDRIIEEERKHFLDLSQMKEDLQKKS